MKPKIILLFTFIFLVINIFVYVVTDKIEQEKVKIVLNDNLKSLRTHYEILLQSQKITAEAIYYSTISRKRFIEIMSKAKDATKEQRIALREEMYNLLKVKYGIMKTKGVLQYQFVFPNNISFLRMHKPSKFGDDLTNIRYDFKYVNKNLEPIRGFTQGRTAHGFRNTFPIFDKEGNHLGAMEVSFSSNDFQWYLNHVSHIHSHFLVNKKIFDVKTWQRDDLILKYAQSSENSDFMLSIGDTHTRRKCIDENLKRIKPIKKEIDTQMAKGEKFCKYVKYDNHIDVIAFLPIKNLENKTVAWLVSYEKSPIILLALNSSKYMRIIALLVSLIIIYLLYLQIKSKELISELLKEAQKKAYIDSLTNVYNRNKFDEVFADEVARVRRYKHKLSMVLIDIDKFKDFNDTYGHLVGDEVLIMLARCVNKNIRDTDTFIRWGGEEFVILLKETEIKTAKLLCIKLKNKIQELEHPTAGNITASFGLTEYIEGDTIASIFKRCDEALYVAKQNGRNRVEAI